jgi:hypothetical protein
VGQCVGVTDRIDTDWRDEFVLARDIRSRGQSAELRALVRSGQLVPMARGVYRRREYVSSDSQLARADSFLARVRATDLSWDGELVFAGFAAAALWRIPAVGQMPDRIDVASAPAAGGRSNAALRRSYVPNMASFEVVDGVKATGIARTVIDVARWGTFAQGVVACDAALHGSTNTQSQIVRPPVVQSDVVAESLSMGAVPGKRKCLAAVSFADGAAESPGESVSRVGMHVLGFPPPVLQQAFFDAAGLIGLVDFWWPEFNLIGEFDGFGKYLRTEFTHGKDAATVVMDEKRRENRLRATKSHPNVARWEWIDAMSHSRLRRVLATAGLPQSTRPR